MMANRNLYFIFAWTICIYSTIGQITGSRTSYFMDNAPFSNELNPALQPYRGYINLGLGNSIVNLSTGTISLDKLVYIRPDGNIDFTINNPDERHKLSGLIKSDNKMHQNIAIQPLGFGFFTNKFFWTFNLGIKEQVSEIVPAPIIELVAFGNNPQNGVYNLKSSNINSKAYYEAAFGSSYQVNEKLNIGAKLKYIMGITYFDASFNQFDITMDNTTSRIVLDGQIKTSSSSFQGVPGENFDINLLSNGIENSWKKPAGNGYGIDLGFTYKPINELTLSGAIIDLGTILWKNNYNTISKMNYDYTLLNGDNPLIEALPDLPEMEILNVESESFTSSLPTTINAGAQYSFLQDHYSVGLLSTTRLGRYKSTDLTLSINAKPLKLFNASISCTGSNLKSYAVGAAMSWTPYWFLNMFLATDYIFNKVTPQYLPIYADHLNVQIGFTIPLSTRKTAVLKEKKAAKVKALEEPKEPVKKNNLEPFYIR